MVRPCRGGSYSETNVMYVYSRGSHEEHTGNCNALGLCGADCIDLYPDSPVLFDWDTKGRQQITKG